MKLESKTCLDALCGEYLLGTLQGPARRRFERALREEPRVALRFEHWQRNFTPRYSAMVEVEPRHDTWKRLERELGLGQYRTPWHRRVGFWRAVAGAVTVVLALAVGYQMMIAPPERVAATPIAQLEGKADAARVTAALSSDRRTLELRAARPVLAGPAQSYELWLLPEGGGPPISMAVLGSLDARFALSPDSAARLTSGAKLAISVEPAGGSPTGGPTGPVILAGRITI